VVDVTIYARHLEMDEFMIPKSLLRNYSTISITWVNLMTAVTSRPTLIFSSPRSVE
jgi:hypothetical protein